MPQPQGPQSAGPMPTGQTPGQFPPQGGYGGPAQSPSQYANPQMYGGSTSAGGYGRGQPTPNAQWSAPAAQNFGNGFGGYQG